MGQEKKEAEIEAAAHASPLMTPDELAELLRCSRRTVYDRVDKGGAPGVLEDRSTALLHARDRAGVPAQRHRAALMEDSMSVKIRERFTPRPTP
ncbi:MAG: helix-turn-helix domain-containing protein [Nannocystis sp.]|nr:helix-turn-helix domain-containing protein [Nannocystis sp.]